VKRPYIPLGCDQQGRQEPTINPHLADALDSGMAFAKEDRSFAKGMLVAVALTAAIVGVIALVVLL
jgi:hypothetical protein